MKKLLFLLMLSVGLITMGEDKPQIGANIDWTYDWARTRTFANIVKQARGFGEALKPWQGNVRTDKDGWPAEDFGVILFTGYEPLEKDEEYNISFECKTKPKIMPNGTALKMIDITELGGNQYKGKIVLAKGNYQFILSFFNTNGGIRNLEISRKSSESGTSFTKEFLELNRRFSVLRFMEFTKTNSSKVMKWEERTKPNKPIQNVDGAAWEYVIEISNILKKDIWINIPHMANDEYVEELAKLMKKELKFNQKIYLEYSNETWNGGPGFDQNKWLIENAKLKAESGQDNFSSGIWGIIEKDNTPQLWAMKLTAKRLVEISKIFMEKFDEKTPRNRIRPVLAGQVVWTKINETELKYINERFGAPNKYIYAIAGAPYFGASVTALNGKEAFFNILSKEIDEISEKYLKKNKKLAENYKVKFIAYEGGVGILTARTAEERGILNSYYSDPKMKEIIKKYLYIWNKITDNELFIWYKSGADQTFGIINNMENLNTMKLEGIEEVINNK